MHIKTLTALAALSLTAGAAAQPDSTPRFAPEAFRAHVAFLSDDLMEGRRSGTRGYDLAARYVATQFEGLGLTPGAGSGWYQQVPFVRYRLSDAPSAMTIGGRRFDNGGDVAVTANPLESGPAVEAQAVFVGYGLDAPTLGFDDYAGLDVRGKIVVALGGVPKGTKSDLAAHLSSDKRRMASARGAAGFVTVRTRADQQYPWSRSVRNLREPSVTWIDPSGRPFMSSGIAYVASLNTPAAEALFAGAPRSLAAVLAEADRHGAKPKGFALRPAVKIERGVATEPFESPNVLAVLPGSDPAVADEYVLLMAHLDHLGLEGEGAADRVNNGAMDNATGIATLIEAARAMAQSGNRPRRSILFAAVTAEEDGLLGSQYLANNPVVGGGKLVGVVNLDMPVLTYDFADVIAFGAEHSTLGAMVERAGAQMGVRLIDDPLPEEGLFTRSDHYRFVQQGIPSVFLMTGFGNGGREKFTSFLQTHYHQPSDEVGLPFDWDAGAKFVRMNYLIARSIADAEEAPRWYADSFFGSTFAPSAPKAQRVEAVSK
jgi:Zn-dependent M28 family amino/carboxypeptidase